MMSGEKGLKTLADIHSIVFEQNNQRNLNRSDFQVMIALVTDLLAPYSHRASR